MGSPRRSEVAGVVGCEPPDPGVDGVDPELELLGEAVGLGVEASTQA